MLPPFWALAAIAWRQYILRFDAILFGHLLFTVPTVALAIYLKQPFPISEAASTLADIWPNGLIRLGIDYGASLLALPVVAIIVLRMKAGVEHHPLTLWASTRLALALLPALLAVRILETVASLIGFTLLIIPGLVVAAIFALVMPMIIWKGLSVMQAIAQVWKLIRGQLVWITIYLFAVQLLINMIMLLIVWGLPVNAWFDLFVGSVSAICVSYYTVFAVILLNTLDSKAQSA